MMCTSPCTGFLIENLTLELSAKAFKDDSEETLRAVCGKLFEQWGHLRHHAKGLSVMLWLADGSEILEYTGRLADTFEWAYWIGTANPEYVTPGDPRDLSHNLSYNPVKYIENPAVRSYSWVKRLVQILRELGGPNIRIGATFDPGPEFAYSDFKTNRHSEMGRKLLGFNTHFIKVDSLLNADPKSYAGFPNGIPQGTPFGSFLGRQFAHYAKDIGFDYLWLSNGIGFGFETWRIQGALFDGESFHPENTQINQAGLLGFWSALTAELKGIPIETRGSNMSAGIEMASDAAPIKDIYRLYHPDAPVNSPWAALNYDTGTEIAGWMSHIAEPPTGRIPFRYYIHDPWWVNSPWLDRYGREPWDIYLPLSVASVDATGKARGANSVSFLCADNSYGEMPDQVPQEVTPHVLEALRHRPDQAGPLLWLYPFAEYHDLVFGEERHPDAVFAEDSFIAASIQNGLPLNTVISSAAFRKVQPKGSIVIAPMSAMRGELLDAIDRYIEGNGKLLLYGPAEYADPALLGRLGLSLSEGLSGAFSIESSMACDDAENGAFAKSFVAYPQFCGGALRETATSGKILAEAIQGKERRVIAIAKESLVWVRSLLTSVDHNAQSGRILSAPPSAQYPVERLLRLALSHLGFSCLNHTVDVEQLVPRFNVSRFCNAFYFSGFCPDTTVEMEVRMPLGAPVLGELETLVRNGAAVMRMPKSWHKECRLFIASSHDGVVSAKECPVGYPGRRRCLEYSGLKNATVHFLPPPEALGKIEATMNECPIEGAVATPTVHGPLLTLERLSGTLKLIW